MIPSLGRIVHLRLSESCAAEINRGRAGNGDTAGESAIRDAGGVIRKGNGVREGDIFPLLITKVWDGGQTATESTIVNGQVFLDGNDCLWATSVKQGDGPGEWFEPPRVPAPAAPAA